MNLPITLAALCAGLLLGAVHYWSLWWNVKAWAAGGAWLRVIAVQVARLALVAGVFVTVARLGALPLLLATLGVVVARLAAVRLVGETP